MTLIADTGSSPNKDSDGSHMTQRILNITLEIIYLLTGEDFEVVKKISRERWAPNSLLHGPPDITTFKPHYQILEKHNMQKILKVTKKMMELLTGEVPIRCQDVTVYFSMEEWQYLEGHKDLYKDVMMDNQPPLTSPGGHWDVYEDIIVEPVSYKNPPERCPHPLYCQDSTQEGHTIPHHHQREEDIDIKAWVKEEEETHLRGDRRSTEEVGVMVTMTEKESSLDIGTEYGPDVQFTPKRPLTSHPICNTEDNGTTQHSRGTDPVTGPLSVLPDMNSPDLSVSEKPSVDNPGKVTRQRNKKMLSCLPDVRSPNLSVPEKPSVGNPGKVTHRRNKKMFSCPECNKSFTTKAYFRIHKRIHDGQCPFVCLECGRGFIYKSYFLRHQRYHSELRPYPCLECGKSFKEKSVLVQHLRIHRGDRPFPCSECDQSFVQKAHLRRHLRVHTGETPFLCKQCGKGFTRKDMLTLHERGHVNERPFACPECGNRFKQQFCLVRHQKLHKEKGSLSRSVLQSNQNLNL